MNQRSRSVTPDMFMEQSEAIALQVLMTFASSDRSGDAEGENRAKRAKTCDARLAMESLTGEPASCIKYGLTNGDYDKFIKQIQELEHEIIDDDDIKQAISCRKMQDSRCQTSANMHDMYGGIVGLHQKAIENNTAVLERPYTGKGGAPCIMKSDRPTLSVGVFAGNRMFSVADTMLKKYAAFKYLVTKLPVQHVFRVQLDAKDEPAFNTLGCPFLDGLQFFVMTDKQMLAFYGAYCQLSNSKGMQREVLEESITLEKLGNFWRKTIDKLGFVYQKYVTPSKKYVHTFFWCQGMYNNKGQQAVSANGGQNKHMYIIKDVSVDMSYTQDLQDMEGTWPSWYVEPVRIQMCFDISMVLPIMACHYNKDGYVEGRYLKLCKESSKIKLMHKDEMQ